MSHRTLAVLWHNQIWHKLTITINSYFVVQRQQHPVTFIGLHAGVHLPVSVIYIKETFHIWSIICLFVLIFVTNEFHLGLGSVSGFRFTPIHCEQYYLYHYINIYLYIYIHIYRYMSLWYMYICSGFGTNSWREQHLSYVTPLHLKASLLIKLVKILSNKYSTNLSEATSRLFAKYWLFAITYHSQYLNLFHLDPLSISSRARS